MFILTCVCFPEEVSMSLFLELVPIFKIGTLLAELQVILAADGGGY